MHEKKVEDKKAIRSIRTDKELDTFFYHISHNLRAPLSSILGATHLAMRGEHKTPEDVQTYFAMIEKSVLKMDHKLAELLRYSKNAVSEVRIEDIDLSKIAQDAFDDMKYMKGHEHIEFTVTVNEDQPFFSDVFRMSVIIENLISNAIKYADSKKEKSFIHVKAHIIPEQVLITFHDNGIGIAEDQLDKVFNMFYRATETGSGSGLGLYLVGEMMDKLKGNIEITSTVNKETFISLTISNNPPPINALLKNHFN